MLRKKPLRAALGALLLLSTFAIGDTARADEGARSRAADVSSTVVPTFPGCTTTQPVSAVTASTWEAVNPPQQAVDGDMTTRWSGQGLGASLVLDLGQTRSLCGLKIAWHRGDLRWNDFNIYTSTDGTNYTVVWAGRSSGSTAGFESYPYAAPVSARYVRISFWQSREGSWGSILETAALGPDPGQGGDHVVVAAGDIVTACEGSGCPHTRTSDRVLSINPAAVLALGDNQYESGAYAEFTRYYAPTWGRFKSKTKPTPGNHEYALGDGAAGYLEYFGGAAAPAGKSWYSFDLGDWHIVSLNSEVSRNAGSEQVTWLQNDLSRNTRPCVLAYWHRPMFSSGSEHGDFPNMKPFWDALYGVRADLVLNGHDHDYERFAKQTPTAEASASGIRQFVVGTGGSSLKPFGTIRVNSQKRLLAHGVVKLDLAATGYSWQFVRDDGEILDSGGPVPCN
ncbi:discoidin domain-containing protein [Microtetraspora niveoalba]|uniref:discoidin domain-containing protein n=1 Tax=Microtetraspora niveoalba TaxID=46175 RepID=UPI00082DEF6B|nr:discoidin domain-containing protein [Microtetraspora niveoalba]